LLMCPKHAASARAGACGLRPVPARRAAAKAPSSRPTGTIAAWFTDDGAHERFEVTEPLDPLRKLLDVGQLEPYIRHVRFPLLRNLAEGTYINFTYPITALVGPNGTNKTAILRALQGCPDYENLGNYWFSTDLDPISPESRFRFIHGYVASSQGRIVEAIKSRIAWGTGPARATRNSAGSTRRSQANPDYFEPSRPILSDDMERMPVVTEGQALPPERVKTRWKAISKKVVYLDFRSELSAFDKYFFHVPYSSRIPNLSAKKALIRRRSAHLAGAVANGAEVYQFAGLNRIFDTASQLPPEQVGAISAILGRNYDAISVIGHRFFNTSGYTVILKSRHLRYSEAFAGSGEFAVVMLIKRILDAEPHSLVLLDEPETSLHPGAQRKLMDFLVAQTKAKKLQIVLSTHSPEIVRDLPPDAIKVLQSRPDDGKIQLLGQSSHPREAFFRLGASLADHYSIFVEDDLARAIVQRAIRPLGEVAFQSIKVSAIPGGAGGIATHFIPALAQSGQDDCLVILDGDQRPENEAKVLLDVSDSELPETLKQVLGGKPQVAVDGSDGESDSNKKAAQYRAVLTWISQHVDYLPGTTPEGLTLALSGQPPLSSSAEEKAFWADSATRALGRSTWEDAPDSSEILSHQEQVLAAATDTAPELIAIRARIANMLNANVAGVQQ